MERPAGLCHDQPAKVRADLEMIPDAKHEVMELGECVDAEVIHIRLPCQINPTVIVFPFAEDRDMPRQPISKTTWVLRPYPVLDCE